LRADLLSEAIRQAYEDETMLVKFADLGKAIRAEEDGGICAVRYL
jgi:hypothetical protein